VDYRWDLILEYAVGNVAVAISWGDYFKSFISYFGVHPPDWLTTGYRTALLSPDPKSTVSSRVRHTSPVFRSSSTCRRFS